MKMSRFNCDECGKPITDDWFWKYPCKEVYVCQKCARAMFDPRTPFPLIWIAAPKCDGNAVVCRNERNRKRQYLPGVNKRDTAYTGLEVDHEQQTKRGTR